ncbi:MAG: thioesterase family protein [Ignavibacteria bacterium]|nr:thioesterase family protein [Ignavibacteria bacterium]
MSEIMEIRHTTQIRVKYADTDKMGVVYNGNYFTYFEVGRTELMRHCGLPYIEFEKAGYILPLVETYAAFKIPAVYDDLLNIEARLLVEHKPLVRFDYIITRHKGSVIEVISFGHTVHCFVNAKNMKPVKPPKMFFEAMTDYIKRNNKK